MKKEEIDVWIQDTLICQNFEYSGYVHRKEKKGFLKAKLIIEIPEKKIEITESELRIAMYEAGAQGYSPFHDMVIKKLGF